MWNFGNFTFESSLLNSTLPISISVGFPVLTKSKFEFGNRTTIAGQAYNVTAILYDQSSNRLNISSINDL